MVVRESRRIRPEGIRMAERKQPVLFTNLQLGAFTGSELQVLELARASSKLRK